MMRKPGRRARGRRRGVEGAEQTKSVVIEHVKKASARSRPGLDGIRTLRGYPYW